MATATTPLLSSTLHPATDDRPPEPTASSITPHLNPMATILHANEPTPSRPSVDPADDHHASSVFHARPRQQSMTSTQAAQPGQQRRPSISPDAVPHHRPTQADSTIPSPTTKPASPDLVHLARSHTPAESISRPTPKSRLHHRTAASSSVRSPSHQHGIPMQFRRPISPFSATDLQWPASISMAERAQFQLQSGSKRSSQHRLDDSHELGVHPCDAHQQHAHHRWRRTFHSLPQQHDPPQSHEPACISAHNPTSQPPKHLASANGSKRKEN
ncbi:hypothetical protein ACLOJK_007491 [Asimina triloba]